jgi:hypothetical protein
MSDLMTMVALGEVDTAGQVRSAETHFDNNFHVCHRDSEDFITYINFLHHVHLHSSLWYLMLRMKRH